MKDYLRLINVNTPGPRCDVTPLFADHEAFAALMEDLVQPFINKNIDDYITRALQAQYTCHAVWQDMGE